MKYFETIFLDKKRLLKLLFHIEIIRFHRFGKAFKRILQKKDGPRYSMEQPSLINSHSIRGLSTKILRIILYFSKERLYLTINYALTYFRLV